MTEEPVTLTIDDIDRQRQETERNAVAQAREAFDLSLSVVKKQHLTDEQLTTLINFSLALEGQSGVPKQELLREKYNLVYAEQMDESGRTGVQPDRRLYNPTLAALEASLTRVTPIVIE